LYKIKNDLYHPPKKKKKKEGEKRGGGGGGGGRRCAGEASEPSPLTSKVSRFTLASSPLAILSQLSTSE